VRPGFLLLLAGSVALCGELSTGFLIGPRCDTRAFYYRPSSDVEWKKTYAGPAYRVAAQGKLLGVQWANALLADDAGATLDPLKSHGVLLVSIALQSAQLNAFRPDGSLLPESMERLERLLRELDRREMVAEIVLFQHAPEEHFESNEAIAAAARNVTEWLIDHNHRNAILSVATRFTNLIDGIRDCFQRKHTDYALPVAVFLDFKLAESAPVVESADLLMLAGEAHGMALQKIARPAILLDRNAAFERASGWLFVDERAHDLAPVLDQAARLTMQKAK